MWLWGTFDNVFLAGSVRSLLLAINILLDYDTVSGMMDI